MTESLNSRCRDLLVELKLMAYDDPLETTSLTGGVASDIAQVNVGDDKYCVKFALPKLKVQADWFAPVHRNAAEYQWLKFASNVSPDCAVTLFGHSEEQQGFAMEFIEGHDVYLWKKHLLYEKPDQDEASKVGALLGQIHAASTQAGTDRTAFKNRDDFHALRIEPYLLFTATKHSDIKGHIEKLASELYDCESVLIHGDVSPKNILFRNGNPIILDAECATVGDPSFDVCFCMNHLVLKAIHLPNSTERYLANVQAFWQAYQDNVVWEDIQALETRICQLLPVLMLARVDGKSPVEYLSASEGDIVRQMALQYIGHPTTSIQALLQGINHFLRNSKA